MSHFSVLVIGEAPEEQLARFDENLSVDEYCVGKVSDFDKISCVQFYLNSKEQRRAIGEEFYNDLVKSVEVDDLGTPLDDNLEEWFKFYSRVIYRYQEEYAEWFKEHCPTLWEKFEETYNEKSEDWNSNRWRKSTDGDWEEFSKYNPDSKWDWYETGGRFRGKLKLKEPNPDAFLYDGWQYEEKQEYKKLKRDGYCDQAYVRDIANLDEIKTFAVVNEGEWYEKGEMGWFGMVSNEMDANEWDNQVKKMLKDLPGDTLLTVIDCHI